MKAVILAGGFGTRLSEETAIKPKPMVEIGGKPILWHIMKIFSSHGIHEFIICLGYKGYYIKEFFSNYFLHMADVTFDMANNKMDVHSCDCEPWRVSLIETGANSMTGGRLKRVKDYLDDEPFCFTYGDGVADIDITKLIEFHRSHKRLATITAVQPPGRFGSLKINQDSAVETFLEKPQGDGGWINGGFFILSPEVLSYIKDDSTVWEQDPLEQLAINQQLIAYRHYGFWQAMDTLRDKNYLEQLWDRGQAAWKVW